MNNYPEDPSLLEVRKWQENRQLTQAEYLEKLQQIAQTMKAQYNLNLPKPKQA